MQESLISEIKNDKSNLLFIPGLVVIIIIFSLFQVFLVSKEFYSISADEAGHVLEGFWWYKGEANFYSIWLPFQKILYGLALHIHYDLFWVPRIISAFFGLLTLLALIKFSNELFQLKIVSIISGFIGSLFFGIVVFSLLPLTEIFFFFFLILSLSLLFNWLRTDDEKMLWLSIIVSGLSTTTRYEAWVFSLTIFFIILYKVYYHNKSLKLHPIKVILIIFLLFSFPLFWIYLSQIYSSRPDGFINMVSGRYSPGEILTEIKTNIVYQFLKINWASLNILGFIPLIYLAKKDRSTRIFAILFFSTLILMSIVTLVTKAMPTHNFWRLASIWSILLLPFTSYWIYAMFKDERKYFQLNGMVFLIILIIFFYNQTREFTDESYTTKEDLVIGEYISENLQFSNSNSKILIERDGWTYSNLLITSQMPDRFITNNELFGNSHLILKSEMDSLLNTNNIEYVVLSSDTHFHNILPSLQEIKKFKDWTIYKFH